MQVKRIILGFFQKYSIDLQNYKKSTICFAKINKNLYATNINVPKLLLKLSILMSTEGYIDVELLGENHHKIVLIP